MEENKYNYKINLPDGISITNVHSYLISYGKAKVIIDTVNENESSQIKIMVEAKDCWNPKDGDICHVTTPDRTQEFIIVYGNKDYSISRFNTEQTWNLLIFDRPMPMNGNFSWTNLWRQGSYGMKK